VIAKVVPVRHVRDYVVVEESINHCQTWLSRTSAWDN